MTICFAAESTKPNYAVDGLYEHGIYVGGQFGYVEPNNDKIHYFNDNSAFIPSSASKIGSRWYAGYSYNDFYAAELGYDRLINASSGDSHTYLSGFDALANSLYLSISISAPLVKPALLMSIKILKICPAARQSIEK